MIRITDLTFPNNFSGTLQLCPSCSSLQDAMVLFGIYIQWLSVIVGVFGWYLDSTDRVWRCAGRCGVGRPRNGRLVATEGKQEYHMFWENGCYKVQIKVQYRTVSMPWVCWAYGASGASSYIFVTDSHSLGGIANSRPANFNNPEGFFVSFCLFILPNHGHLVWKATTLLRLPGFKCWREDKPLCYSGYASLQNIICGEILAQTT